MLYFLTSSPFEGRPGRLTNANGFRDRLLQALPGEVDGLFIASAPDRIDLTERFSKEIREILEEGGIRFSSYQPLDSRNKEKAKDLVSGSQFLFLAGGHVPTQNAFFQEIGLKELLQGYQGVILGISAGSMNAAEVTYAQPEVEGESLDPTYQKFLPGLGLTRKMILPHYQLTKKYWLDGKRLYEGITLPDSYGHTFYAFPDGTYLYGGDGLQERILGEAWVIQDGVVSPYQE